MECTIARPIVDYGYVKRTLKAMHLTIELFRGENLSNRKETEKTIKTLCEWPKMHVMDVSVKLRTYIQYMIHNIEYLLNER